MVCACVHVYVYVYTHAHFHRKETLKSRREIPIELIQFDLVDNTGKGIPDKGNGMGRSFEEINCVAPSKSAKELRDNGSQVSRG